jgi:hypothetical protein
MNESDIATIVTVDALFPEAAVDEAAMREGLSHLSRDDALFTCARFNAIVSGFGPNRPVHQRQDQAVSLLQCPPQQLQALTDYAKRHGGPGRIMVFFRGQLLELARWVARYCENRPGDSETFKDPAVRSAFFRAALIASGLWERQLFGEHGIRPSLDPNQQRLQLLGAFRRNVEQGNQAAHPGFVVARGWLLFSRFMPAHLPQFAERFEKATGLTLRQYFICAFAILARTFSDHPEYGRIFRTDYVEGETPFKETFRRFLQLHSQSPEEWRKSLESKPEDTGYLSLRERPIFRFADNRSIIFDPTFFLDNLTSAPLFHVKSAGVAMQQVSGAFGSSFEDYAKDLLRRRFPHSGVLHQRLRCNVGGKNANKEEFEVDAVLNDVMAAVMFEIKANWIRDETVLDRDPQAFLNEVRKKYGALPDSEERDKGVAQLARSIGALTRREWRGPHQEYALVASVYPVLLVFDVRMAAPGIGHFLDSEFRTLLGEVSKGFFVHRLIILTVSDLEHLISGVESLSLEEFLRAYSSADPERVGSVHNFIANSAYLNQVRPSPILEELMEEFMAAARAELLPSSPPLNPPPENSSASAGQ